MLFNTVAAPNLTITIALHAKNKFQHKSGYSKTKIMTKSRYTYSCVFVMVWHECDFF